MRLSMLLIASILWATPARAQDAAAPVSPGQAAPLAQADTPLTWQDLHKASLHRKNWGRFVTVIGVLGVGLSLSMIAYEFSVMPQNSSDQYCSLGCEMNLMMGTFYGITGLGMLGTGIGMLIRSFNLGQLSEVMRVEGPSPVWGHWHEAGMKMRMAGNFLAPFGSLVLGLGAAFLVPAASFCGKRHCSGFDEGDLDMAYINAWRNAGLVLAIIGGAMVVTGVALVAAGYLKQHRLIQFRGRYVQPRVLLSVTPGGLSLIW